MTSPLTQGKSGLRQLQTLHKNSYSISALNFGQEDYFNKSFMESQLLSLNVTACN